MQRQIEELELIYQYLTGPRFRQRIEAIVEKFSSMQTDLERERKAMTRLRAKREGQIRGVMESTAGMYGDLQGIAGKSLEEIDGLVQIARRVEARRKRGPTNHRIEPISSRPHPLNAACVNQKEGPRARYQIDLLRGRSTGPFTKRSDYVRTERTSRRSAGRRDRRHTTGHELRCDLL